MAGDWIKMRTDLFTHPKVVRIASALKADTLRAVGGLMSVWCLFDAHSDDGFLDGYTPEVLDAHLRWEGFAAAMMAVGWLQSKDGEGLVLPRFDMHNGQSSKRRAQEADRKREGRKASASDADKKRTREEKRRYIDDAPQEGDSPSPSAPATHETPECKSDGSDSSGVGKRASRLPADWVLPKAWGEWALAENQGWIADDVRRCADKFADHWRAKAGKDAAKLDWLATWRNWVRNDRTAPTRPVQQSGSSNSIFAGMI